MTSTPDARSRDQRPILWLHSHFMLPMGGTKFVFEVARRLVERQPLEVLVERASPLWKQQYADAGIPLHEIGGATSTSMSYWGGFPAYLRRDDRAIRPFAARSSAVVSSLFPMPWLASRVAHRYGIPHVSLCFEPFPFFHDREVIGLYPAHKRAMLGFLRGAYGWIDVNGIKKSDRLLTLNESTASQITRVYGRKDAALTYAGVDASIFHPYPPDQLLDLRSRMGPGPLAIHSTDFSPIKRTDLALRAFAVAVADVPDARLMVTSTRDDPGQLAALRQLSFELGIGDRVDYLGFVPIADLPRLYALANVLVQTGTSSGAGATTMSLPVKEALACGTPAVRSGTNGEDVEDGVSGFLVDPRDVEETGRKVARLLADRAASERMGEAGRQRIIHRYTWDRVVDVVAASVLAP